LTITTLTHYICFLMDLLRIKQVGIKAAYRAGKILNAHFGNLSHVTKKGDIDLVTEADIESEKAILSTIHETFPEHSILAEESGGVNNSDDPGQWIIDPLDGTTNFTHNLPIFAVSIAFAVNNRVMVGVVFNPIHGELFTAIRGKGAYLNDRPMHVSKTTLLQDSLLVTGFPYNFHSMTDTLITRFTKCLLASQGVRRLGSAALDLCYVAAGRFDGFWENNLKPWDTAAGALIAQEAGGQVTDFKNTAFDMNMVEILATNGYIHQEMIAQLHIEDS
jgi:myo-inositol-1(or 4)-monophosphatase